MAPSYHFFYNYNAIDVSRYLQKREKLIAVHTLYQGLINRVWQSGDNRHGLILDLMIGGKTIVTSDETFRTAPHTAYSELGTTGYATQFLERYDSNAREVAFAAPSFEDSYWEHARRSQYADHTLTLQLSPLQRQKRHHLLHLLRKLQHPQNPQAMSNASDRSIE